MTNISVVLVSGGMDSQSSHMTTAELLYTNGSRICTLPNLPYSRSRHTQTGVTACGGDGDFEARTSCHTLSSTGSWELSHNLAGQDRRGHCAWASPQGTVLLGSLDSRDGATSEILLENGGTTPGFNLDYQTR